jgi:hypothetical protein
VKAAPWVKSKKARSRCLDSPPVFTACVFVDRCEELEKLGYKRKDGRFIICSKSCLSYYQNDTGARGVWVVAPAWLFCWPLWMFIST